MQGTPYIASRSSQYYLSNLSNSLIAWAKDFQPSQCGPERTTPPFPPKATGLPDGFTEGFTDATFEQ